MNDLVIMKNDVPVFSTFDLFAKMGYREHRMLKKVITDNFESFEEFGLMQLEVKKPTKKEGGRPSESYLLNEDQFMLLVLLAKNSPESVQLKVRVSREFKRMKQTISKANHLKPTRQAARSELAKRASRRQCGVFPED